MKENEGRKNKGSKRKCRNNGHFRIRNEGNASQARLAEAVKKFDSFSFVTEKWMFVKKKMLFVKIFRHREFFVVIWQRKPKKSTAMKTFEEIDMNVNETIYQMGELINSLTTKTSVMKFDDAYSQILQERLTILHYLRSQFEDNCIVILTILNR